MSSTAWTAPYTRTAKSLHWIMALLILDVMVMGFYMQDDLGKYDDRVAELNLAHNSIRFAMAQMDQAYDEEMSQLKKLWNLGDYVADID